MKHKNKNIIISGGGTGGHIFPAIAIANALQETLPEYKILFVGAKGRMEMEKVPAAGYPIKGLWISGLQRRLTYKNILFPFKVIVSMLQAKQLLNKYKPSAVIGVGGYASGPMLKAAQQKHIPTLIQEQNSYAGLTNKMLAKKAKRICVAYDNMHNYFPENKIVFTGNPVRKDILNGEKIKNEALKYFNIDKNKKTVLVIGGSLGAGSINNAINSHLPILKKSNYQIIWQTGKLFINKAQEGVKNCNCDNVSPMAFISKMDYAYAAADVVISRAGALSISELCLVKKPVILIPSPNVAEDHQTKNAMALVKNDAAIMVKDKNTNSELIEVLNNLLNDSDKQILLSENISKMGKPNAAYDIANEIKKMIKV